MAKCLVVRLGWLAGVILLTGLLLLAIEVDGSTWTVRESGAPEGHAGFVTCATAVDCATPPPDRLRSAWMTAC
jgi:hypothetical protein